MRDFNQSEDASRIGVLDGLRALAITLVLMRHSVRAFWPDLHMPFLKAGPVEFGSIFINGWMGVDLFFVLSGFLIATHLLGRHFDDMGAPVHLGQYLKRRFFRIAPAYYLVLTLVCVEAFPFFPYPVSRDHLWWQYFYHLIYLQDYLPSNIVVVFWSLAVEIKFYLLAPFFLWLMLRVKNFRVRLALMALLIVAQPVMRSVLIFPPGQALDFEQYFTHIRSAFHLCLDGLLCGTFCAMVMKDHAARRFIQRKDAANGLFFAGLAGFLGFALSGPLVDLGVSDFDITWMPTLIAVSFAAMMLGLLGGSAAHKCFEGKALTFIAVISYSLYLIHLPMLFLAEIIARHFVDFNAWQGLPQYLVYLPFFIGCSVFAATLMYIFVEKPFIDWSRR